MLPLEGRNHAAQYVGETQHAFSDRGDDMGIRTCMIGSCGPCEINHFFLDLCLRP